MKNPKQIENLPWREIDGRVVIIHPKRGEVHEFNPVGTLLWKNATGTATLDELIYLVCEEFDVDFETAKVDAQDFFTSLAVHDLLCPS